MKFKFVFILLLTTCKSWPACAQLGGVSLGKVSLAQTALGRDSLIGKSSLPVCAPDNYSCYPLITITYTFIGSGNWSIETNWLNNTMPPAVLQAGTEIIVNGTGECILNVPQKILLNTKLTIMPGKKLKVLGDVSSD